MDLSMMTKFDEWYLRFGGNGAMMQLSSVRRKAHGLLSFQRNDKEGSKKIRISEKCVCYCEASAHTGCGDPYSLCSSFRKSPTAKIRTRKKIWGKIL
jgi:hypothetical protein